MAKGLPKGIILRALAKKNKFLMQKKKEHQEQESNIENVDEMAISDKMLGNLYNERYLVIKYLGSGTFSRVWLVYDVLENKYFAMKMYYPKYSTDAEYEIKYLKQLGNTEHVVRMFDYFQATTNEQTSTCLIVDLMGKSLMTLYDIYDRGVPFDMFKQVTYHALQSLDEIHRHGIIHTDIKLENLMLQQLTGEVKEVIEWFDSLCPNKLYLQLIADNIPEEMSQFPRNKQKMVKRQIKKRAIKALQSGMRQKINEHVNEMCKYKVNLNESTNSVDQIQSNTLPRSSGRNSPLNNNISYDENQYMSDDDMPDIVAFDSTSTQDNLQVGGGVSNENISNETIIHDDQLDLDLNKMIIKIADMGNACSVDNIDDDDIQIRSYRAPEVVMGEMYNEKVDIWSMACLFYELLTHEYLFEVNTEHDDNVDEDRLLLSQMYSTLGKIPYEYCIDTERTYDLFDERGRIKKYKKVDCHSLEDRIKEKRPDLSDTERQYASNLIRRMMDYDVKKRASAHECLSDPIYSSPSNISTNNNTSPIII
jgi:serine/threonine-protein kinase SRPK3